MNVIKKKFSFDQDIKRLTTHRLQELAEFLALMLESYFRNKDHIPGRLEAPMRLTRTIFHDGTEFIPFIQVLKTNTIALCNRVYLEEPQNDYVDISLRILKASKRSSVRDLYNWVSDCYRHSDYSLRVREQAVSLARTMVVLMKSGVICDDL